MTAQLWIELVSIVLGGGGLGGGGAKLIAKLTRLAIAVEQARTAVEELSASNKSMDGTIANHEARLTKAGLLSAVPAAPQRPMAAPDLAGLWRAAP